MSLNSARDFDNLGLYFFSSPTVDAVNPGNGRHVERNNFDMKIILLCKSEGA